MWKDGTFSDAKCSQCNRETYVSMEYGHWGITVSQRRNEKDYAPFATKSFTYPVSTRGPIDSAATEKEAIQYCRSLNGIIKGPFFYKEE